MTAGDRREQLELLPPLDDQPGPAKPISDQRAADMVSAAIERAYAPVATVATVKRGSAWRTVLVAAAVLAVAGVASAGIYRLATSDSEPDDAEVEPQPTDERVTPPPGPAPELVPPADPEPTPVEVYVPAPVDVEPDAEPKTTRPEVRRDPRPSTPEDLLAQANERRGDKQWRAADTLYQRVIRKHGGTSAAYVATIASASLRLDHLGDARGALKLFRKALKSKPRGYLAEEARSGIAECHRALGNAEAEAEALRELIDEHPDSPLRGRAEKRLRSLQ
jgi:tetratricopeptide (TPR) repeat protein